MTSPSLHELDLMASSDPYIRTALEFIWAFTEWWERMAHDPTEAFGGEWFSAMEEAYEQWMNQR